MKQQLHPTDYRPVVFQDEAAGFSFVTRSTVTTQDTINIDGQELPLVKVHISSASHPHYTGEQKTLDIEGRVDRFKARQEAAKARADALASKAKKATAKATKKTSDDK